MKTLLGYEVKKIEETDAYVQSATCYHLIGKRATYRLVRSYNAPQYLHAINSRGNICAIKGNSTFSDIDGTLIAIS